MVYSASETKVLLMEMLSDTYQENISLKLLDPQIQIKDFLSNVDIQDLSVVKLFMRVVIKASENNLLENNFREFLKIIIDSSFVTKRLDHLINVEMHLGLDIEVLKILIPFLKLLFQILPGLAYDALFSRVLNLSSMVDNFFLKYKEIDNEIVSESDDLKALASNSCPYLQNEEKKKIKPLLSDYLDPPNNYREISIFPTIEDVNMESQNVFLRRNKIAGSYKTVDDYLDVQFRLLREDFIQPFREGILHFQNDHGKERFDIRLYQSVFVLNSFPDIKMGIIFDIKFDNSDLKSVNWFQSKRFIYGSLLCLSADDFQTLFFATVAKRDIEDLEQGIVKIKFHNSGHFKGVKFTMIEALNMFESYRHVLLKLQETNEKNLCLQKYLVFADENINLPGYLSRNNGLEYTVSGLKFFPGLDNCQWPSATELGLDESQFQAFKTALTKEISIIQGPPGTGKTCLGLKICSCLLENVQRNLDNFGPILVVCYTNHALDQFLEGILKFNQRIIRIGSRCKSKLLQNYLLMNWKKQIKYTAYNRRKRNIYIQMDEIKKELLHYQAGLKIAYDTIISLDILRPFIDESHHSSLEKLSIRKWLDGASLKVATVEEVLENIIEFIIFEEIIDNAHSILADDQTECMNKFEKGYVQNDTDVNFINNNEIHHIDDEDFSSINVELQDVIDKMLSASLDGDMLPMDTDGFTLVSNRIIKKLYIKRLRSTIKMNQIEAISVTDIDNLNINDRWKLYRYWRSCYIEILEIKSNDLEHTYENLSKQLNEIHFEEDRSVMMTRDVIGMTTTGAARYGRVLAQIRCKIIIVEEAAEVLESHVVASLNPGCEHLILIGDHKQLKPNPAVYELAKTYQLDLSLFERLINNNLHFNTLELQHRMRPEISEIMKFIYPDLKNHPSVLEYPNVPAVSTNIFFFDHSEQEILNEEIISYSNPFEAEFVVNFCRHLIKNGVENSRITVLTLYSGQLFLLRSEMSKQTFEGIRVCVADNYQGEENDIIILSLVRSNEEDKIGFLSIENRICVCLSRAKMGLYVFGNFQLLSNQNDLWKDICLHLRRKHLLGDTLELLFQNNPEKRLEVQNLDDFKKYSDTVCAQSFSCRKKFIKLSPYVRETDFKYEQHCTDCLLKVGEDNSICNHVEYLEYQKNQKSNLCHKNVKIISPNFPHEVEDCEHSLNRTCVDCDDDKLDFVYASKLNCRPYIDNCQDGCVHSGRSKKFEDEYLPCMEKCDWKCKHKRCTKKCYEKCDRDICDEYCDKMLDCDKCKKRFQCYGVCGESCRRICLKCDPEVKRNFFGTEENEDAMFITLWTCGHSFECESMDQYMNTVPDDQQVVPKRCPKCDTVIDKRSCFRYLNIIRNIYQDN